MYYLDANTIKGYEFITISNGYSQNVEEILSEIEKQMINILKEDRFYHGTDEAIHSYFQIMSAFAGVVSRDYQNIFKTICGKIFDRKEDSQKNVTERMNKVLRGYSRKTKKRMVIVIDDLERSANLSAQNLFTLLMETTRLEGCITIVSCDYEELIKHINPNYIDKYFERTYTIRNTSFRDMLKEFPKEIYICNTREIVLDGEIKSINEVYEYRRALRGFYDKFLLLLRNPEKLVAGLSDSDIKLCGENLLKALTDGEFKDFILAENYIERFNNARVFRRIWRIGIKGKVQQIITINTYDSKVIGKWKVKNWPQLIAAAVIVEYILPDLYDYLIRINETYDDDFESHDIDDKNILSRLLFITIILLKDIREDEYEAFNWIIFDLNKLGHIQSDYKAIIEKWNNDDLDKTHLEEFILLYGNNNENLIKIFEFINKNLETIIRDEEINVIEKAYYFYGKYFNIDEYSLPLLKVIFENLESINKLNTKIEEYGFRARLGDFFVLEEGNKFAIAANRCNDTIVNAMSMMKELAEVDLGIDDIDVGKEIDRYINENFMPKHKKLKDKRICEKESIKEMIALFDEIYHKYNAYFKAADTLIFLNRENNEKYSENVNKIELCQNIVELIRKNISIIRF